MKKENINDQIGYICGKEFDCIVPTYQILDLLINMSGSIMLMNWKYMYE